MIRILIVTILFLLLNDFSFTQKSSSQSCEKLIVSLKKAENQFTINYEIEQSLIIQLDSLTQICDRKKTKMDVYRLIVINEINNQKNDVELYLHKFHESLQPVKTNADSINLAFYYNAISGIYVFQGKENLAIVNAKNALKIAEKVNNDQLLMNVYSNLGRICYGIGDYHQGLKYIKKGLNSKNTHLEGFQPYLESLMAIGYEGLNDFKSAISHQRIAVDGYLKMGDSSSYYYESTRLHEFKLMSNMSSKNNANSNISINEIEKLHFKLLKFGDTLSIMNSYRNLSLYSYLAEDFDKSTQYSKTAYNLAKTFGNFEYYLNYDYAVPIIKSVLAKNDKFALKCFEDYDKFTEDQYDLKSKEQSKEFIAKYNLKEKEANLLISKNKNLELKSYIQLGLLIGISLFAIITLYILRKNKSKEAQIVKLRLKAMQGQMNPHFLFNSLNSINHFVSKNDAYNSQYFIGKFAKVMRLALQNSQEEFITLEQEIAFLENYLILEKQRMENFDFEFQVSDELKSLKIPPFIIQPLIENALVHGFRGLPHEGILIVKITKQAKTLLIEVIDNGWGIDTHQEKGEDHVSYSTKINNERLKLYTKSKLTINYSTGIKGYSTRGTNSSFELPILN